MEVSPTIKSLVGLGFRRRVTAAGESASYMFPHLYLTAIHAMSPTSFRYVVLLTGVVLTSRSVGEVESQIPPDLESPLEAAAWVSYALRSYRKDLEPLPDWFVEGEGNWDLIPHVRERREYEARPKCYIEREYARPLRRKLLDELSYPTGEAEMIFSFDGRILRIVHRIVLHDGYVHESVHEVVASGDSWPCAYRVSVAPEATLPTRFNRPTVEVSVFKGYILFDERYFWPCEPVD